VDRPSVSAFRRNLSAPANRWYGCEYFPGLFLNRIVKYDDVIICHSMLLGEIRVRRYPDRAFYTDVHLVYTNTNCNIVRKMGHLCHYAITILL
jgi:hypothetical protein